MTPEKLTSGLAIAHLYRRYQAPEFFSIHELKMDGRDERGYLAERRADFVTMRMWGGQFQPLGFEVKVSRSDFLHELQRPEKREAMENYCSQCYFVAPPKVLTAQELPKGWGWLELQATGLRMRQAAQQSRKPANPYFLGAMMKRMLDDRWHDRARRPAVLDIPAELWKLAGLEVTPAKLMSAAREALKDEIRLARDEAYRQGQADSKRWDPKPVEKDGDLDAMLKAISKATGLPEWQLSTPEKVAAVLAAGFNRQHYYSADALRGLKQKLELGIKQVDKIIGENPDSQQETA